MKELKGILRNKKAYIFDMDGTLVNLERLNYEGFRYVIRNNFNLELNNDDYQTYFSGMQNDMAYKSYTEAKGIDNYGLDKLTAEFKEYKRKQLKSDINKWVLPISGAKEYLHSLKQQGVKISLGTSSYREFAELILKHMDMWKYFDFTFTSEDINKGKPNPEIYERSIGEHNVAKDDAVIFEDSKSGLLAALDTGVLTVGIHTEGLNDSFVGMADYVIENYETFL